MDTKICNRCRTLMSTTEFNKRSVSRDGINHRCRKCVSETKREYRDNNIEKVKKGESRIRNRHRDKINRKQKEKYYKDPDKATERLRKYRLSNKEKVRLKNKAYYHKVIKKDPTWQARRAIYSQLRKVLNYSGGPKVRVSEKTIGYGPDKLRKRIEVNFSPGMSWDNYGTVWHIDHVKPIRAFIQEGETRPQVINMLCNLRPLWASENTSKGGKWKNKEPNP